MTRRDLWAEYAKALRDAHARLQRIERLLFNLESGRMNNELVETMRSAERRLARIERLLSRHKTMKIPRN